MVGLGTSGWTPWRLLGSGGAVTDPPSVVRSPDGVLRVFAHGSDGALAHCALTTDGTFTPWSSLYLQCVGTPAAIVDAEDFMSVFVRGVDDHLWHCVETERGVWSRRLVPGGKVQSDPVVAQRTDGRLTVFAAGLDSALWEYAADARHMEPLVPV